MVNPRDSNVRSKRYGGPCKREHALGFHLLYGTASTMYLLTGETRINEHVNLIAPDRESQISLESEQGDGKKINNGTD